MRIEKHGWHRRDLDVLRGLRNPQCRFKTSVQSRHECLGETADSIRDEVLVHGVQVGARDRRIKMHSGGLAFLKIGFNQKLCRFVTGSVGRFRDQHDHCRRHPTIVSVILHNDGGANFPAGRVAERKVKQYDVAT